MGTIKHISQLHLTKIICWACNGYVSKVLDSFLLSKYSVLKYKFCVCRSSTACNHKVGFRNSTCYSLLVIAQVLKILPNPFDEWNKSCQSSIVFSCPTDCDVYQYYQNCCKVLWHGRLRNASTSAKTLDLRTRIVFTFRSMYWLNWVSVFYFVVFV